MKRNSLFFTTLIFLLISCGPSEQAIQKAISQTQTAEITPTPTEIPIKDIDLSEIMFQDGDLPSGFELGQITNSGIPFINEKNSFAINWIRQEISYKNDGVGSISIGLSKTIEESQQLYDVLIDSFGTVEGEQSSGLEVGSGNHTTINNTEITYVTLLMDFSIPNIPDVKAVTLAFHKCVFTGYITLSNTDIPEGMINYIERLSQRLVVILNCND